MKENESSTAEKMEPWKCEGKTSTLSLNQSRKKNEKYVNALMKENAEKYAQVHAQTTETNVENKQKRRKRNERIASIIKDNDKGTQVFLCCGQEVNAPNHVCPICKSKKVSVVERSTQAYFVDIHGYVDEHLQKASTKRTP